MVKLGVPCAPVASYADIGDKDCSIGAHMYENGYICDVDHRDYGMRVLTRDTQRVFFFYCRWGPY